MKEIEIRQGHKDSLVFFLMSMQKVFRGIFFFYQSDYIAELIYVGIERRDGCRR